MAFRDLAALRLCTCLTTALVAVTACSQAAEPNAAATFAPAEIEFFETKIRPVLIRECYECHAADSKQVQGGLRLDTRAGLLKGGDSGPSVVPGDSKQSVLIAALKQDGFAMPPKGKLADAVIADFVKWIDRGAADPREGDIAAPTSTIDFDKGRKFWSFQAPVRPERPRVKQVAWPRTEIDYFILAALESRGLHTSPPATKREWLRRVTFDVIGLPPTPAEIDAFLQDDSPQAEARVVDRLLASPHYGERWGRYWLDVARYAEDQAHTFGVKPNTSGYRYRDWVVSALNDDLPYNEFVKLQVAADKFAVPGAEPSRDIAALGYFGLGAQYYKNSDAAKASADELDDRVDTLTRGFLGLTVSCARCHDHKFDPIPTQDYYSLAGIFQSSKLTNTPLAPQSEVDAYQAAESRMKQADANLKKFVSDQKRQVAEAEAQHVARYAQAAWKLRALGSNANGKSAPLAKQFELHEPTLKKWIDLFEPRNRGKLAALESWKTLCETNAPASVDSETAVEVPANVVALTEKVQAELNAVLAVRDAVNNGAKKNTLTGPQKESLDALFSDKGVCAPSDGELQARMSAEGKQAWESAKSELATATKSVPPLYALAHTIADGSPVDMKVFIRGNPARQGELAPRRFLRVVAGDEPPKFNEGSGRRELAEALTAPSNPLTARVMVNRLWQHHFGRGIVGTPSNFGQLGERPTHPELLDYLAVRFVDLGWSMKQIHRELLLSATYAQSSRDIPHNAKIDVANTYLWRMNRQRLDVESWRDALLAVSGQLDPTLGGSSTDLANTNNVRRTIYAKISRHDLDGLLRLFDFPDANITSDARSETTVPQQQLFVLNSPFMIERAKAFAKRVQYPSGLDDAARVNLAFALAFGREAAPAEISAAVAYLARTDGDPSESKLNQLNRWERLAQAILGANEFMYVD